MLGLNPVIICNIVFLVKIVLYVQREKKKELLARIVAVYCYQEKNSIQTVVKNR